MRQRNHCSPLKGIPKTKFASFRALRSQILAISNPTLAAKTTVDQRLGVVHRQLSSSEVVLTHEVGNCRLNRVARASRPRRDWTIFLLVPRASFVGFPAASAKIR